MIRIENIDKSFGNLQVLKGVSATIESAKVVSIVGASGAGKSTLLQIIGTLLKPDSGKVYLDNVDITSLTEKQYSQLRNQKIGFVFQFHHLLPEFNALENICIPAFIQGMSKSKAEKKAMDLLNYLGLQNRMDHKPSELSGGEQQRVAVARALINDPSVILADEPSGNLDSENKKELHQLFFNLRDKFKQTFVIVTHDKELARQSDFTLELKDGIMV